MIENLHEVYVNHSQYAPSVRNPEGKLNLTRKLPKLSVPTVRQCFKTRVEFSLADSFASCICSLFVQINAASSNTWICDFQNERWHPFLKKFRTKKWNVTKFEHPKSCKNPRWYSILRVSEMDVCVRFLKQRRTSRKSRQTPANLSNCSGSRRHLQSWTKRMHRILPMQRWWMTCWQHTARNKWSPQPSPTSIRLPRAEAASHLSTPMHSVQRCSVVLRCTMRQRWELFFINGLQPWICHSNAAILGDC